MEQPSSKLTVSIIKEVLAFSAPLSLNNLIGFAVNLSCIFFVGHTDATKLSAAALANMLQAFLGLSLAYGLSAACDSYFSQSIGAKKYSMVGSVLQRAIIINLVFSIPVICVFLNIEPILIALHQLPEIAKLSAQFMRYLIPSFIACVILEPLKKFYINIRLVRFVTLLSVFISIITVSLSGILVFYTELSFLGAALAISIGNCSGLVLSVIFFKYHEKFKFITHYKVNKSSNSDLTQSKLVEVSPVYVPRLPNNEADIDWEGFDGIKRLPSLKKAVISDNTALSETNVLSAESTIESASSISAVTDESAWKSPGLPHNGATILESSSTVSVNGGHSAHPNQSSNSSNLQKRRNSVVAYDNDLSIVSNHHHEGPLPVSFLSLNVPSTSEETSHILSKVGNSDFALDNSVTHSGISSSPSECADSTSISVASSDIDSVKIVTPESAELEEIDGHVMFDLCWQGFDRTEVFSNWIPHLKLAVPSMIVLFIEWGSFEAAALISGNLGTIELATHSILATTVSMAFMIFFGLSVYANISVGNALGAGDAVTAKVSLVLATKINFLVIAALWLFVLCVLPVWGRIFSNDAAVIARVRDVLPIMLPFFCFDAVQAVFSGGLRGAGRPDLAAYANMASYVVIGLPASYALSMKWSLAGVWVGLTLAVFAASAIMFLIFYKFINWEVEKDKAVRRAQEGVTVSSSH